ncbi:L-threonylcarbamoyladenylate synthase [Brackiella oedipodis]|uniref:L-threonylcarbamoyladenylate synthase n=1 Tax=Brackiella oedipodis TaxID=124225 RepID=UPI00048F140B|nr:L-threonylcarbamoyladenylate synthase [Brackiella oedipodis]
MSILFDLHPDNPQYRYLKQAAQLLQDGHVLAIPTDSSYALVCQLDNKDTAKKLRTLRGANEQHLLTLMCKDLSEIAKYAKVDNQQYRLLKAATPGPWTFILQATKDVPKKVSHPSRKTIGIRIPNHKVVLKLLDVLGEPLVSTTFMAPDAELPFTEAGEFMDDYKNDIAGIITAGPCQPQGTTVVDLTSSPYEVIRQGLGDPHRIGL